MAEQAGAPARRRRRWTSGTIAVALIGVLAGVLFTANARLAAGDDRDRDLGTLYSSENDHLESLADDVDTLQREVDELSQAAADANPSADVPLAEDLTLATGRLPVSGPGVRIVMDDASDSAPQLPNVRPDLLVVHQQDIEAVLNALWAAGAEAITVQGERMGATSAVRCIGNVLLLHGRRYSPPYTIEAIGDPQVLKDAVLKDPGVGPYLEWVELGGLGWELTERSDIEMPAFQGA